MTPRRVPGSRRTASYFSNHEGREGRTLLRGVREEQQQKAESGASIIHLSVREGCQPALSRNRCPSPGDHLAILTGPPCFNDIASWGERKQTSPGIASVRIGNSTLRPAEALHAFFAPRNSANFFFFASCKRRFGGPLRCSLLGNVYFLPLERAAAISYSTSFIEGLPLSVYQTWERLAWPHFL